MKTASAEVPLYQLRVGPGERPMDLMEAVVQAAWKALEEIAGRGILHPHRWAALHGLFLSVFKTRLVRYAGCGELEQCRTHLRAERGGTPAPSDEWGGAPVVYTLESGRTLDRFLRLLGGVACRRFLSPQRAADRRAAVDRVSAALRAALEGRVYQNPGCASCSVRRGLRERRLWERDAPDWGGMGRPGPWGQPSTDIASD